MGVVVLIVWQSSNATGSPPHRAAGGRRPKIEMARASNIS